MNEYISKGDAIFAVSALPLTLDAETTQRAIEAVRHVPAADVVEVVRCKDCVWYVKSEGVCTMVSSRGEPGVPIQCYCSHGVRRCKEGME